MDGPHVTVTEKPLEEMTALPSDSTAPSTTSPPSSPTTSQPTPTKTWIFHEFIIDTEKKRIVDAANFESEASLALPSVTVEEIQGDALAESEDALLASAMAAVMLSSTDESSHPRDST